MPGARSDLLVVGGGVIGVNVARELKRRRADCFMTQLEKETACGRHASGRNSGVLHAGCCYTADSLKVRFTRDGNRDLTAYRAAHGVSVRRRGKLVNAVSPAFTCSLAFSGFAASEIAARPH